jgi:hypothetical protein
MARGGLDRLGQSLVRPDIPERRGRLFAIWSLARQLHELAAHFHGIVDGRPDRGASFSPAKHGISSNRAFHFLTVRSPMLKASAISLVPHPSALISTKRARTTCFGRLRADAGLSLPFQLGVPTGSRCAASGFLARRASSQGSCARS